MRFEDFARSHGLIIRDIVPHRWISTPTEDHPRKRNGRYKFMGDYGWVQNWATMPKPSLWQNDTKTITPIQIKQAIRDDNKRRQEDADAAARKAAKILHSCRQAPHIYLENKGFPDEIGNVLDDEDGSRKLVIPMRLNGRLIGAQLINEQGEKKFLYGQRTKGAAFVMDAKGIPMFCEGFATALSVRAVMKAIKLRYSIYVCFSAFNIQEVANSVSGGIVIADNDPNHVGETSAKNTSKPYWISDTVGEDFNDYHRRVGIFKASQSLKKIIVQNNALPLSL